MKIAKFLNQITSNVVLLFERRPSLELSSKASLSMVLLPSQHLWPIFLESVYHFPAHSYGLSTILLLGYAFPNAQNITPQNILLSSVFGTAAFGLTPSPLNSGYIFFWSKLKILFYLNFSILCSYLLNLALFANILCFSFSITVFNTFLFIMYFSFSTFKLRFVFNSISPLNFLSRKLTSFSASLYPPRSYLASFFIRMLCFLRSYPFCHPHTWSPYHILSFCHALAFEILDRSIDSICSSLQNLLVHYSKHNDFTYSSSNHYFL